MPFLFLDERTIMKKTIKNGLLSQLKPTPSLKFEGNPKCNNGRCQAELNGFY